MPVRRFIDGGSRLLAWLGGALILLAAILVTLDVLVRNLFGSGMFQSFELSTYAFAVSVAFGFAYALVSKAHIRIEVVYSRLPALLQRLLDVVAIATLFGCAFATAWYAFQTLAQSWSFGAVSNSSLAMPLILPQGLWFAGLAWFALTAFVLTLRGIAQFVSGRHERLKQEIGVATLEEEIAVSTVAEPGRKGRT